MLRRGLTIASQFLFKRNKIFIEPFRLSNNKFIGEFDPGSGRTLAACLTHASRTELRLTPISYKTVRCLRRNAVNERSEFTTHLKVPTHENWVLSVI
jgi:hypothetical protein